MRLLLACVLAIIASCLGLIMPLVLKWLVDGPLTSGDLSGIWLGGLVLVLLGAAEAGIFGVRRWLTARPLAEVEASMREALYRRLQRLPIAFHDRWSSGQLLSRGMADLSQVRGFLALPLTFLAVNAVTLVAGYAILLGQQWMLGLVLLVPAVPLAVLCSWFQARHVLASRRAQDLGGDLTTLIGESIRGIRVIKGFGRHDSQTRDFRKLVREIRGVELHKARLLANLSGMFILLPELAIATTLAVGVVQVADGTLSAGTLLAFLATVLVLRPVVESTGSLLAMSNQAATAVERYREIMDEPLPAEERRPDAGLPRPRGPAALVFENVHFRYPSASPDAPEVLRGVDLRVEPGETVALVGSTGSGKTTLVGLVPRLYEPTGGRITLDGQDITDLSRSQLRTMVAVAFEDPALFSASVMENVLMGGEAATEAEGARALQVAQADGFVRLLPSGPHTQVGEQGLTLSGGERQRLALARAVVGQPRLLVLDDPLSALDIHTEAAVERALRQVLATTTALIVAHRPSTALLADRVALLRDGRVAAMGTHQELLKTNSEYARLMSGIEPLMPCSGTGEGETT
ncbi:ABC transporter ATP-binding protein [Streptomyces sp. Wh19]|nr:ABC transporter ATP-binding protein [Streptomyces sp. Wh19]MDV9194460.1 ABC transporter ATP-binding protein [Streptomyces sp. Wh19]